MAGRQNTNDINIFEAIHQFCVDKGLTKDAVLSVIKDSLVSAYKKKLGVDHEDTADIQVDISDKNEIHVIIPKKVIESESTHPFEINVNDAKKIDSNAEAGSIITVREKPLDLSRILSNQARQMVFQKLKDMERENLYKEYKVKEGELTHGYFQRWINKDTMSIDLGKVEGIMPRKEQNPGEKYKSGDRLKAIISKVELSKDKYRDTGLVIILSRASGDFVRKLFEMEIPEIYDGLVEIVDIGRIPSIRTKIVVKASRGDIDPVGACVGMKGVRIQSIVRELGNERIDIIEFSDDPVEFITNAISPAKPMEVRVDMANREALVVVSDDSLSLAIGASGSNVKLASQLSKFRIDIKSLSQYNEDMSSPEARAKLERLFSAAPEPIADESQDGTPLSEIPGLTSRVIQLLEDGGVKNVETLIEMDPADLEKLHGIGQTTAQHILKLLSESVELVEET